MLLSEPPASEPPAELPIPGRTLGLLAGLIQAPGLDITRRDDDRGNPALSDTGLAFPTFVHDAAWYRAATAHAAAHRRFARVPLDRTRLTPIAQVLIGALEDARVEWRLGQELPGLQRWWRAQHQATPERGNDFLALLARLARRLADPDYRDEHPWIAKGEALIFTDASHAALVNPAGDEAWLRQTASRLGHDIGQMRLPFNPRTYTVEPAYRDDHRCLWRPSAAAPSTVSAVAAPPPSPGMLDPAPEALAAVAIHRYPEWDRLIARHRPAWTTIQIRYLPLAPPATDSPERTASLGRLAQVVPALAARQTERRPRLAQGADLDLPAVVAAQIDRRLGRTVDDRVYTDTAFRRVSSALVIVVDASASTAIHPDANQPSVLEQMEMTAGDLATAWRRSAGPCIVQAFRSRGRHEVDILTLGTTQGPLLIPPGTLVGTGSTRLGAAIRHATATAKAVHGGPCRILILTDGQPHDIDCHDPRYLVEDARQAVTAAHDRGVTVHALGYGPHVADAAVGRCLDHIFGRGCWAPLRRVADLPRRLAMLNR
jgi:nitric oxide reductase NorD protein